MLGVGGGSPFAGWQMGTLLFSGGQLNPQVASLHRAGHEEGLRDLPRGSQAHRLCSPYAAAAAAAPAITGSIPPADARRVAFAKGPQVGSYNPPRHGAALQRGRCWAWGLQPPLQFPSSHWHPGSGPRPDVCSPLFWTTQVTLVHKNANA